MTFEIIAQRYKFITDEGRFWDTSNGRPVDDLTLLKKLAKILGTTEKATQSLALLKLEGKTRAKSGKKKTNTNSVIMECYKRLKADIPLRRVSSKGVSQIYILDPNNQVQACGDLDKDKFRTIIADTPKAIKAVTFELEEGPNCDDLVGKFILSTFVDALYQHFIMDMDMKFEVAPVLISWDPAIPAFRSLNPALLVPGPTPAWDEWLSRVEFPDTFKAYLWSVLEPKNKGRQALWIRGEGADGKSSAINAIISFLGREHVLAVSATATNNDFFFGSAFGKRLTVYMDCLNPYIIRAEHIKSLLGGDNVPINNKYNQPFTGFVQSKLIVLSNPFPKINYYDNSERSRLLLCTVKTYSDEFGDPDFAFKLEQEMPAFLVQCRNAYETECPNNVNLKVPKDMTRLIKSECMAKTSEAMDAYIFENLEFNDYGKIRKYELHEKMLDDLSHWNIKATNPFLEDDFSRLLLKRGAKTIIDKETNVSYYLGVSYQTNKGVKK